MGTLLSSHAQNILYVDLSATAGLNDGSTWANAFINPQYAFDQASNGDEVWIAKGTYIYPQSGIKKRAVDRTLYFKWEVDSLKVYGGFNGDETSREQRDWKTNETILSGELQNDSDSSNNAYHVMMGPDGALGANLNYSLIDGLIIEGGHADGSLSLRQADGGGFVYEEHVRRIDMNNMVFRNNFAFQGGAISFSPARITGLDFNLNNCTFHDNSGTNGSIISANARKGSGTLTATNCLMHDNYNVSLVSTAYSNSFHIALHATSADASIELINCTITNNKNISKNANKEREAVIGARVNKFSSFLRVKNCIVYGNTGDSTTFYLEKILNNPDPIFFFDNNVVADSNFMDISTATANNTWIANPLFANAAGSDFTLTENSPAIDKGDSSFLDFKVIDLKDENRISGDNVDLGCYEYQNTTSIEHMERVEFVVYPNPTNGELHVVANDNRPSTVRIFTMQGALVKEVVMENNKIDVSDLNQGMYFIQMVQKESIGYSQFIKK